MFCYAHKEREYIDLFRHFQIFPEMYNTILSSYIKKKKRKKRLGLYLEKGKWFMTPNQDTSCKVSSAYSYFLFYLVTYDKVSGDLPFP